MAAAMSARAAAARRVAVEGNVLRALVQRVAQHEARLEVLEAERRARHADPVADERLLASIANRFGSAVFTVGDLRRGAASDADLRAALTGCDARRLGARLKRLHRQGGGAPEVVERVPAGREAGGALWCVSPARHTETP